MRLGLGLLQQVWYYHYLLTQVLNNNVLIRQDKMLIMMRLVLGLLQQVWVTLVMLRVLLVLHEVSVGSLGSHQLSLLGNSNSPSGQRELDLGVVHLGDQGSAALASRDRLASDDLDGVSSCSMPGSHVSV